MSKNEQKANEEDGCALRESRELISAREINKRKTENSHTECSKKKRKGDQSSTVQNGGCHSDVDVGVSQSVSSSTPGSIFGTDNQEVCVVKFLGADDPPLLGSSSTILKNIEKDGDIDDMCTFVSSPNAELHLTSPTKSGDINEILASFHDNIPLSCSEGLVPSSTTPSSSRSLLLTNASKTSSVSLNDSSMPLISEDLEHLEEMEKESSLSHDSSELLSAERSIVDSDSGLDFRIVESDRSNTLMTPQEIEHMPSQGLEFEASVGSKDGQSLGMHEDGSISSNQLAVESALSLDSDQGATQFIVNTEDGKQQVLSLKMSDVYQVVHLIGNPADNIALPPGFSIQDGFLVLPVTTCSGNVDDNAEDGNQDGQSLSPAFTVQRISQNNGKFINMPSTLSGKLYCCMEENCGRLFDKQSKLRVHIMSHTGVRPFKCEIEGCQWAFRTNFQLKRHHQSHLKRKDFKCDHPDCGRLFSTIYNLTAHKKLHSRPLIYSCTVCDQKFATQRKLDVHHKTHDNAEKSYKCPYPGCDRVFFSANCMGSHARWHSMAVDLTCHYEGCGRVFTKLCRLKTHLRMHTGDKPFVCKTCGAAFTTNSKLVRHEGIHTGVRPYACPVEGCGKRFPRQEHLTGHLTTHTGEKPFECPFPGCGSRFSAKSSMQVHYKKHQDGSMGKKKLRFPCPLEGCQKVYTTKASLRGHLMKHVGTNFLNVVGNQSELEMVTMLAASADFAATSGGDLPQSTSGTTATGVSTVTSTEGSFINPTDYLIKHQQTTLTSTTFPPPDVITHHVGNNVVTQLVVSPNLGQPMAPSISTDNSQFSVVSIASDVAGSSDNSTIGKEQEEGSARTDYVNNQVWSVRAKNRRQLLKHRLSVGFNFDEKVSDSDAKNKEPVLSGPTLNPHELLTSRAITFRDPETGTTYVQTQLLQDDPPNPEIYSEDEHASHGGVSLPVEGESSNMHDSANVVDFTGTTINLQDLA